MLVRSWLVVRVLMARCVYGSVGLLVDTAGAEDRHLQRANGKHGLPASPHQFAVLSPRPLTLYRGNPPAEAPAAPSTSAVTAVIEIR
jgi:hypothetical protein